MAVLSENRQGSGRMWDPVSIPLDVKTADLFRTRMQALPRHLRSLVVICFGFSLFIPLAFQPFGNPSFDGEVITYAEFWRRGGGTLFLCIGSVFPLIGLGIIWRSQWARPLYFVFALSFTAFLLFSFRGSLPAALTAMILLADASYLFVAPSIRNYFFGSS